MTRLFRSKSCGVGRTTTANSLYDSSPHCPSLFLTYDDDDDDEYKGDYSDEDYFGNNSDNVNNNPVVTTPLISLEERRNNNHHHHFPVMAILVAVLRKSLVTCSVEEEEEEEEEASSVDIGWPTDVRHVSHVTFDRFNGFLGLPVELQPDLPRKVPSASASVFGVSANSMQCSYDGRGNSVPTVLLMMQKRLYSSGGLQAEGIFRINGENSQEEYVRDQLNKGVLSRGIDAHCLAGLIKAWFRELPTGVLDSLTPEQVMHCNTEDECTQHLKLLPPTEGALLDWAINLMADVVEHEHHNKMNARNIAMVFAPNMTQMADPLTALIHAVQVMNFLKTLIMKNLQEREESSATVRSIPFCVDSPRGRGYPNSSHSNSLVSGEQTFDERPGAAKLLRSTTLDRLEADADEKFWSFQSKSDTEEGYESMSCRSSPVTRKMETTENGLKERMERYDNEEVEGILNRLSLKKGMRKLCRHPMFQLTKSVKKSGGLGIVNSRGGGGEAWE